jgi:predicted glycosyltransferase
MKLDSTSAEALEDFIRAGGVKALDAVLSAAIQRIERGVLQLELKTTDDTRELAARHLELQGARKLAASVLAYVGDVKKRIE